jgi:mannan endo-1,4-beta-mannosidase
MNDTVTNIADGTRLNVIEDSITFPGERLYRVELDVQGGDDAWRGISIQPGDAETKHLSGITAVSFDVIYKWRAGQDDTWDIEFSGWGKMPVDLEGLTRFAAFSGEPVETYAQARGIDLMKPDRPAQTGYGSQFYAELSVSGKVLDAYHLGDSESLGYDDGHPLGFYGRKRVTLYSQNSADLSGLTVRLYVQPKVVYSGSVWFSECRIEPTDPAQLPPELITEAFPAREPVVIKKAAVTPADPNIITSAADALAYLKGAADAGYLLYGVQNYRYEKGGGSYKGAPVGTSDVFDLAGTEPAVFGLDSLSLIGMENAWRMPEVLAAVTDEPADPANIPAYIEGSALRSIKAWENGAVPTLSMHMSDPGQVYDDYLNGNSNPFTGRSIYSGGVKYPWNFYGYGYDNSTRTKVDKADGRERSEHRPMLRIYKAVTGAGADRHDAGTLEVFNAYLDIVADYCLILQEHNVPVLLRPFHENSGDWFWWGPSGCENEDGGYSPDIFITNWRHLVDFLQRRGVRNALYVYSPNGADFDNTEKLGTGQFRPYAMTYPGDAYVDICAFDDYTTDQATLVSDIKYVTEFAAAHGKVAAASEVTGSPTDPNITEFIFNTLSDTEKMPVRLAYFLQWTPPSFAPYLKSPTRANSGAANAYIRALGAENIILSNRTADWRAEQHV